MSWRYQTCREKEILVEVVKVHGKASCRDYEAQPMIVGQNRHLYRRVGELEVAKAAGFPLIEKPNIIVSNEVGGLF
jgi:hypothetical protein